MNFQYDQQAFYDGYLRPLARRSEDYRLQLNQVTSLNENDSHLRKVTDKPLAKRPTLIEDRGLLCTLSTGGRLAGRK